MKLEDFLDSGDTNFDGYNTQFNIGTYIKNEHGTINIDQRKNKD